MIHLPNSPLPRKAVQLAPEEGIFELAGSPPAWIWVHTCPTPKCTCRIALILATFDGRAQLIERCASVHAAWNEGGHYVQLAEQIDQLVVFEISIDSAEVYAAGDVKPLVLREHPTIAAIAKRIDGHLLDQIAQLWYRGKGLPDPGQALLEGTEFNMKGWRPGAMRAWREFVDLRQDIYELDGRVYEAVDLYCVKPECTCGEVTLSFESIVPRRGISPGHIDLHLSGTIKLVADAAHKGRLAQLWATFQQRYPDYLALFGRRDGIMKGLGARVKPGPVVRVKAPGRNDACPCESGKKYKKCCGAN